MLKEMTDLMNQVSVARQELTCDQGEFHARLEPPHILVAFASLVTQLDAREGWPHPTVRELAVSALAHIAAICRDYLADELQPEMSEKELESLFNLDMISSTLVMQAMGITSELKQEAPEKVPLRVVH